MQASRLVCNFRTTRPVHMPTVPLGRPPVGGRSPRRGTMQPVRALGIDEHNIFLNIILSSVCVSVPTAISVFTSENREGAIERLQTVEGAAPFVAAAALDAVAHSIPILSNLLSLVTEPLGAAAGVAYLFTLVLSSPSVDPNTLAPKGTVLNAEKANDVRASVRVPLTQIAQTTLKVVDFSNSGSSGMGWETGKDGLPKLPVNSVAIVVGVGVLILEAASHAPVLSLFMPRVLQVTAWLAAAGYVLDRQKQQVA
eukprot:jgi/Botrbrau1/4782/Bobra.0325s0005.1